MEINNLYADYKRGSTTRREFLRKLTVYAGGAAAATVLLSSLESDEAMAMDLPSQVPQESDLFTEWITYPGKTGEIKGYLARPHIRA
jgi:carboxymethylenebutenolidase